jgi:hypothetical protein
MKEFELTSHFEEWKDEMDKAWEVYCSILGVQPNVNFAFSRRVKKIVKNNSRTPDGVPQCENCDNCLFDDNLEAAHWVAGSNAPKDGRMACRPSHFVDHALEVSSGLTSGEHAGAARIIWGRMTDEERKWLEKNFGHLL